jgi:divalent metal cation (Fe/Co/Zn/Cd) transporter
VCAVSEVKVRWLGHRARAEVEVTVDPTLAAGPAHDLADAVAARVREEAPEVKEVAVRTFPA